MLFALELGEFVPETSSLFLRPLPMKNKKIKIKKKSKANNDGTSLKEINWIVYQRSTIFSKGH